MSDLSLIREPIGSVFTAVFETVPEGEDGGYTAHVEEVPGAISEGDTLDEARENMRDALAMMLKSGEGFEK